MYSEYCEWIALNRECQRRRGASAVRGENGGVARGAGGGGAIAGYQNTNNSILKPIFHDTVGWNLETAFLATLE